MYIYHLYNELAQDLIVWLVVLCFVPCDQTLGLSSEHMRLVLLDGTFGELKTLESPHKTLKSEGFSKSNQVRR